MLTVYVLNMPHETERRAHMEQLLTPLLTAVDGSVRWTKTVIKRSVADLARPAILSPAEFDVIRTALAKSGIGDGEVGCWGSHLNAWAGIADQDDGEHRLHLVLEDDLRLPDASDFIMTIRALHARRVDDWRMLRAAGRDPFAGRTLVELTPTTRVIAYSKIPMGAGAYFLSPAGARAAFRSLAARPALLDLKIDVAIRRSWQLGLTVRGLRPLPFSFDEVDLPSSIDALGKRTKSVRLSWRESLEGKWHVMRDLGPGTWVRLGAVNAMRKARNQRNDLP
jgi:GR25 family glycosyltransferase involved in LPS biosynthesis